MNKVNDNKSIHVGILTFHNAVNPGSALQAYALWNIINKLSADIVCHIINYQGKRYRNLYVKMPQRLSMTDYLVWLHKICHYMRYRLFWNRIDESIRPKHLLDNNSISSISGYDTIVVGSDQIWNPNFTNRNTYVYFLPFISNVKKIAYAASIGVHDFPDEDKEKIAGYLKDFQFLSVREPEAQDAIEKLIGRRPELVIDPSFLLKKNEYEKMAKMPKMKNGYIFLYLRHKDSEVVPYARKMAEMKGLQLVECHGGARKIYKDDKIVMQPGPKEWLGWLLNATYVFTDSFHGCAFCINCNKQFFVKVSSANAEMSSRIYHILDRYGMMSRLIEDEQKMLAMPDIDFSKSNAMLMQDRERALDYLRTALDIK